MQGVAGDIPVFKFAHLSAFPEIDHQIFTRGGGFSKPPFDSLNVAYGVGDDPRDVARNRERISNRASGGKTVYINQVHGTRVVVVPERENAGAAPLEGDAMVTDRLGIMLMIQVADCQSVLLYEPDRRVVANVHSGWRGSVANILAETLRVMTETFACDPSRVLAGIGPSLGPCCAEFIHFRDEIPRPYWDYRVGPHHFDFWSASRDQLVEAGVPDHQVHAARLCTRCRNDLFFSYRKEKVTGRFAAMIGLKG